MSAVAHVREILPRDDEALFVCFLCFEVVNLKTNYACRRITRYLSDRGAVPRSSTKENNRLFGRLFSLKGCAGELCAGMLIIFWLLQLDFALTKPIGGGGQDNIALLDPANGHKKDNRLRVTVVLTWSVFDCVYFWPPNIFV